MLISKLRPRHPTVDAAHEPKILLKVGVVHPKRQHRAPHVSNVPGLHPPEPTRIRLDPCETCTRVSPASLERNSPPFAYPEGGAGVNEGVPPAISITITLASTASKLTDVIREFVSPQFERAHVAPPSVLRYTPAEELGQSPATGPGEPSLAAIASDGSCGEIAMSQNSA